MDFGLRREMIKTAQPPPPPPAQDLMQLPENVMESTPTLPAATHSTSVPSTQSGTSTASKAQRELASTWTGPVSLVPRPAWIAQLGTDLSILFTASAGESPLCSISTPCRNRQHARFHQPRAARPDRRRASFEAAHAPPRRRRQSRHHQRRRVRRRSRDVKDQQRAVPRR